MIVKINDLKTLPDALRLSHLVFNPTPTEIENFHQPSEWSLKIANNGLLVTAYEGENIVGFAICYQKSPDTLHLWNAGVDPKQRGKGIFGQIFMAIENFAKKHDYKHLSLNTYQDKFPQMYAFAISHGFRIAKQEIVKDEKLGQIVKSRFTKNV